MKKINNFFTGLLPASRFFKTICSPHLNSVIFYIVLGAMLAVFAGCDIQDDETGSLSLKINSTGPSNVIVSSYKVALKGPNNQVRDASVAATGIVIIDELAAGSWAVTVNAMNESNVSIGSITEIVKISEDELIIREIEVPVDQPNPIPVTGSLTLNITTAGTGSSTVASYKITLNGPNNQVKNTSVGLNGNITINDLDIGVWSITANAVNASNVFLASKNDTATVSANQTVTRLIAFTINQPNPTPDPNESFRDDFNGTAVDETKWTVATWQEESLTGRERCIVKDGYLNLVFRNNNGTYLGAAIQSRQEFMYGRWEARLKPTKERGVLNSFFTIDWDNMDAPGSGDGTKQEIDVEFLTNSFGSGSGQVHYAVHAAGRTSFNTNPDISLGFNPSDDFHIYAIDITRDRIQWLVDGRVLKTYTYAGNNISINAPYWLKLNVYTQTGGWVGGPPRANVDCTYQVDWIRFVPYQ